MRGTAQAPEQAPFQAHRLHHLIRPGTQHGCQVKPPQGQQEENRDHRAQHPEPFWHSPLPGQCRHGQRNQRHDCTVPQGKPGTAVARQHGPLAGIEAGQAINRGQVVSIETMLHAQHKSQDQERQPIGRQGIHGTCMKFLNIFIQVLCQDNTSLSVGPGQPRIFIDSPTVFAPPP